MKVKHLFKGLLKSIPGVEHLYNFHKETGGTDNARYCYAVWMRHLLMAWENGYTRIPATIAELGPGDSLGIGLSALLSGAEKYYALDVIRYSNTDRNLLVFEELVKLFRAKAPVPHNDEFPNMRPKLKQFDFPHHILTDEKLNELLDEKRLDRIRAAIRSCQQDKIPDADCLICYMVPWADASVIQSESVDMIISQAVLQHVNDLPGTYSSMNAWLKKDGILSHNIDLKSMGSSDRWYGHWTYSPVEWKIVKGRKKYLINREPYSVHIQLAKENGFKVIREIKDIEELPDRNEFAHPFKQMKEEDMTISSLFMQAVKTRMLILLNFVALVGEQIQASLYCSLV
jgi:hypothetical protein